jgi:UDP-GlcNAc:undecaprenyl-phosphate GlcNAc-1-phosphate transferase
VTPETSVLLAFGAAVALTAAGVPVVRRLAHGGGLYEQPVEDRWHLNPVPKFGGAAMAPAFLLAVWIGGAGGERLLIVAATAAMFLVGLADDYRAIPPRVKFAAQLAVAAGFLALSPAIPITGQPVVDAALSIVWFVGITNAFNLLDNIDGLAAGVAAIAGAFLVLSFFIDGNPALVALAAPAAAMTGVAAGFLVFNWHPASIFMGDGGSHLIGAFFASTTLLAVPHLQSSGAGAAIVVVLLLVPCADTALVSLTRHLSGRSAFVGGRDHLSHRLVALGADDRRAVLVLYAVAFAGGLAVVALQTLGATRGWAVVAAYSGAVLLLGVYLAHVDVQRDPRERPRLPLLTELARRFRLYEVALDALLVAFAYYLGLMLRFREPEHFSVFLGHFTRILPLVAGLHIAGLWMAGKYEHLPGGRSTSRAIFRGSLLGSAASVIAVLYLTRFEGYSRQAFALAGVFTMVLLYGEALAVRTLDELLRRRQRIARQAIVCGAGPLGALAVRELRLNSARGLTPIGLLDDAARRGDRIEGLPVLGRLDDLDRALAAENGAVGTVVVAMEALPADRFDELCAICGRHGADVHQFRVSFEAVATDRRERGSSVVPFPRG